MSRPIEDRIAGVAARQHGVVTRAQLMEAGLSPSSVKRRLRSGRLTELQRGVYLTGPLVLPGGRAMAAVLATAPGGVVSHLTAAELWGLGPDCGNAGRVSIGRTGFRPGHPAPQRQARPTETAQRSTPADATPIDISIVRANRGRRPGIRVHRVARLDADERTVVDGMPVTTPARTIFDIASVIGSRELERAVARAERDGLVDRDGMWSLISRHRGLRGVPALRAVLEAKGGPALTRSEAESTFLDLVRDAALPLLEVNVAIGRYEIDFLWRGERLAVEIDGFLHHASRPRFEGDRRKDAWLVARGFTVVRLSWRQVAHQSLATAVQVGQALARARAPRGG